MLQRNMRGKSSFHSSEDYERFIAALFKSAFGAWISLQHAVRRGESLNPTRYTSISRGKPSGNFGGFGVCVFIKSELLSAIRVFNRSQRMTYSSDACKSQACRVVQNLRMQGVLSRQFATFASAISPGLGNIHGDGRVDGELRVSNGQQRGTLNAKSRG
jgi:hypothetical protein